MWVFLNSLKYYKKKIIKKRNSLNLYIACASPFVEPALRSPYTRATHAEKNTHRGRPWLGRPMLWPNFSLGRPS